MSRDLSIALMLLFVLSIILVITVKLMFFGFIGLFIVLSSLLVMIIEEQEAKRK